jgi:hypothetical protein
MADVISVRVKGMSPRQVLDPTPFEQQVENHIFKLTGLCVSVRPGTARFLEIGYGFDLFVDDAIALQMLMPDLELGPVEGLTAVGKAHIMWRAYPPLMGRMRWPDHRADHTVAQTFYRNPTPYGMGYDLRRSNTIFDHECVRCWLERWSREGYNG